MPRRLIEVLIADHKLQRDARSNESNPLWAISRSTAWRRVKAVMREARIAGTHASPKGLRHGFGVAAIQAGVPLNLLQKWMGHTDISVTEIYANAVGDEEYAVAKRMWKNNC